MSLRYPESLGKKNWPEPTRWTRQSNAWGFMVGLVVGFYWFFSSMMSVLTPWLILFPFEYSCVLILVSLWHPTNLIWKKITITHLLCPCCVHLMCVWGTAVGKVAIFFSCSIVCHKWWHDLDLMFDATQCKCSTLIILLVIHTYLQISSRYYYYW